MSEIKIQLNGWLALVVIVALIAFAGLRFMTLDDMSYNDELMVHIEGLLQNEYAPHVVDKLNSAIAAGDKDLIEQTAASVTSTSVNISSVKASYPVLGFSTQKDVVVKVVYSFDDDAGTGEEQTIYYLFRHGVFGWQYQYITSSLNYYLNFI